jgi:hypothetical protein
LDKDNKAALVSDDPFIRAFAIIDRRTGKRALEKLTIGENEHSIVKTFYRLRINARFQS